MRLRRQLGRMEVSWGMQASYRSVNNLVALALNKKVDRSQALQCIKDLTKVQPLLRVKVENRHNELYFSDADVPTVPIEFVSIDSELALCALLEKQLNSEINWDQGPLVRLTLAELIHEPGSMQLIVCAHPSALDLQATQQLAFQLAVQFAELRHRPAPHFSSYEMPLLPALDNLLPSIPISLQTPGRLAKFLWKQFSTHFLPFSQFSRLNKDISEEAVDNGTAFEKSSFTLKCAKALNAACQKQGVSLLHALHAASLLATYRAKHVHLSSACYLNFAQINLRSFLEPVPPVHLLGNFSSLAMFNVDVGAESNLWQLAHEIKHRQDEALLAGEPILFQLLAPQYCDYVIKNSPGAGADIQWTEIERIPETLQKSESFAGKLTVLQGQAGFGASASFYLNWHNGQFSSVTLCYATTVFSKDEAKQLLKWTLQILGAQCAVEIELAAKTTLGMGQSDSPNSLPHEARKGASARSTHSAQKENTHQEQNSIGKKAPGTPSSAARSKSAQSKRSIPKETDQS